MCPSIFVTCMGRIYPIKVEWKLLLVQQFSTPHFGQTTHEPSSFEIKSQSMGRPRSGLTDLAAMSRWTSGWWSGNIRCLLSKIPQRKSVRSFRRLASQRNNKKQQNILQRKTRCRLWEVTLPLHLHLLESLFQTRFQCSMCSDVTAKNCCMDCKDIYPPSLLHIS